MPTEGVPEYRLDTPGSWEEFPSHLAEWESRNVPLVQLVASVADWERLQGRLLALRSANVAGLLRLEQVEEVLSAAQVKYVLGLLRDWDQMSVANFLALCERQLPEPYRQRLKNEARLETKWLSEWLTAGSDARVHKYPGLPWRSFIRKIVRENYEFAMTFVELTEAGNQEALGGVLDGFLEKKKQVVCLFPKKWGRSGT